MTLNLRNSFKYFFKNAVLKKETELEQQLQRLQKQLNELIRQHRQWQHQPPITIEYLYIEKIVVDNFKISNDFGALGIKELSGVLNIGANYGTAKSPAENARPKHDKPAKKKQPKAGKNCSNNSPIQCNIKFR